MIRLVTVCAVLCCQASSALPDIWCWGDNWLLDPGFGRSQAFGDHTFPLDVRAGYWRTAWEDPKVDIESELSGFYQLGAFTTMDRYQFALTGGQGHFAPAEATPSFFGGDRLEVDLSLGYMLHQTLVAFGGWRIVRYAYDYEEADGGQGGPRMTANPTYAGFQAGLLLAVPVHHRVVPFGRMSSYRLTAEGDYAPVTGSHSEWGVAIRPTAMPLSLIVGHLTQKLRSHGESGRGSDERFSGIALRLSYVFGIETPDRP